jgi:hypothetical protein
MRRKQDHVNSVQKKNKGKGKIEATFMAAENH